MNGPLVSIVVPVYNGERYLTSALQSIFKQDYRPFEVIVVDDGSVDDSAKTARSFQQIHYIYQSNQGAAAARNTGVAAAQGELIAFLDADDVWVPHKLGVQADYLLRHPEVGYVVAKGRNFLESRTNPPGWLTAELLMKEVSFLPSTLVVRKDIFYQVGEFDCSYVISEDTDWFFRARDAGVQGFVVPEMLLYRRIHDSNLSSQTQVSAREMLLMTVRRSVGRRRHQDMKNE